MVIITVNIINDSLQRIKITIDDKETIYALKQKIVATGFQSHRIRYHLDFAGEILSDENRLIDYEISDGDTLTLNILYNGGEVGSCAKGFTDPTKVGPIKYATTIDGPDYLIVNKGINFFGNCVNKKCIAYNKEVSSPFGFGTFDLMKDLNPDNEKCPKCPSCEIPLLNLETCGFMLCKYKYVGKKIENDKIVPVNYEKTISEPHHLDYFDAGKKGENKSLWIDLKISAYQIKK